MSSEILLGLQDAATVLAIAIFLLAAFRALSIARGLVNRVYRNRAYITGVFSLIIAVNYVLGPTVADNVYVLILVFLFVLLDTTILVSLDTDFFHRNTLRWRQVRIVVYPLLMGFLTVYAVGALLIFVGYLPSNFPSTTGGQAILVPGTAILLFALASSIVAAAVSARRSSDLPLRRFMQYLAILVLLYFVNTLIWTQITMALTPFIQILYAIVTYRMAMSLSPIGKVEKAAEATTPSPATKPS